QRFPHRRVPNKRIFVNAVHRLRQHGTFTPRAYDCGRVRPRRVGNVEEAVLESMKARPGSSTRRVALQHAVFHITVWLILNSSGFTTWGSASSQSILNTSQHVALNDGAVAHNARIVPEWLNTAFPGQWIGRNGPIACDFFYGQALLNNYKCECNMQRGNWKQTSHAGNYTSIICKTCPVLPGQ
ncbi:hypothetical protein BDFB_012549, partial [Asbolus verrucosus]